MNTHATAGDLHVIFGTGPLGRFTAEALDPRGTGPRVAGAAARALSIRGRRSSQARSCRPARRG
jgi:hypothetical protein